MHEDLRQFLMSAFSFVSPIFSYARKLFPLSVIIRIILIIIVFATSTISLIALIITQIDRYYLFLPRFILNHFPLIARNYCDTNKVIIMILRTLLIDRKGLVYRTITKFFFFLSLFLSLSSLLLFLWPFLWNVLLNNPGIFLIVGSSSSQVPG